MSMWEKPLTRENLDEFFRLFASPAYRSTYRILCDTTRTENALTESFLEVYHQRNSEDTGDLVFLFSDILQRRVESLALRYPVMETARTSNRVLDEFTENSILSEIHHRIDSTQYRILEFFSSSAGKANIQQAPVMAQIQKTGVSVFLIIQLILAAILIFSITYASAKTVFVVNFFTPLSASKNALLLDELIVPVLDYLPLTVSSTAPPADADTNPGSTKPVSDTDKTAEQTTSGTTAEKTTETTEQKVSSATKG